MNAATKIVGAVCNRIVLFKAECGNGGKWSKVIRFLNLKCLTKTKL